MVALASHRSKHPHSSIQQSYKNPRRVHSRNRRPIAPLLESLESRTLLSSTIFVTNSGIATDATHFHTLQAALSVAQAGDTIMLQSGFSTGTFISTSLTTAATAGSQIIHTATPLDVGDVISIGGSETNLVTAVTPSGTGDFLVSLASALAANHASGSVDASNPTGIGPIIGLNSAITLSADPGVSLPFNLQVWTGVSGVSLTNLSLTNPGAATLLIDGDSTFANNVSANLIQLDAATNSTLMHLAAANLDLNTGSTGNSIANSTLTAIQLATGTNSNSFMSNTITTLTAIGGGDNNGGDSFAANTFNGPVTLTGNDTVEFGDAISSNTFNTSSADALTLNHASGSLIQNNMFHLSANARGMVLHNSDDLEVTANNISANSATALGILVVADGAGSASVDLTNNVIQTTTGTAVSLLKSTTTAALEVRAQGNDLRLNAIGILITGDGASAGNIDLGGDTANPTRFDTSIGGNDFSSYPAADASHFAIGLFHTSASYSVEAQGNTWSVPADSAPIADSTHTPAAAGSGFILLTDAPPPTPPTPETLTLTVNSITAVQGATTAGILAQFTSSIAHVPADFTATITWGDGTTSQATILSNGQGGFTISASHLWTTTGVFTLSITLLSNSGATTTQTATATITAPTPPPPTPTPPPNKNLGCDHDHHPCNHDIGHCHPTPPPPPPVTPHVCIPAHLDKKDACHH